MSTAVKLLGQFFVLSREISLTLSINMSKDMCNKLLLSVNVFSFASHKRVS